MEHIRTRSTCLLILMLFCFSAAFAQDAAKEKPKQEEKQWLRITGHSPKDMAGELKTNEIMLVFDEELTSQPISNFLELEIGRAKDAELGPNYFRLRLSSYNQGISRFSFNENLVGKESGRPLAPEQRTWAFGILKARVVGHNNNNQGSITLEFNSKVDKNKLPDWLLIRQRIILHFCKYDDSLLS